MPALLLTACLLLAPPRPVAVGELSAAPPESWASEKPSNLLRSHQFRLKGDKGACELAIYPEASPKVEEKFAEWGATFELDADQLAPAAPQKLTDAATAHRLDLTGTWKYRERPRDPKSKEERRENSRVVWVVVVQGGGATHIRLSGPKDAVAEQLPGFDRWLASLR